MARAKNASKLSSGFYRAHMKKLAETTYSVLTDTFRKYLENKHDMPFGKIEVKNISDEDLVRWKEIENLRDVKIGFSFADNVKRDIRG